MAYSGQNGSRKKKGNFIPMWLRLSQISLIIFVFTVSGCATISKSTNPADYNDKNSYQFEGLKWGESKEKILQTLQERNKTEIQENNDAILYKDKILDEPCQIYLQFTPKTKLLAIIMIRWNGTSAGPGIKNLLEKKYGWFYDRPNQFMHNYVWRSPFKINEIILDYTILETKLVYYGGGFEDMYNKETDEINYQESGRF